MPVQEIPVYRDGTGMVQEIPIYRDGTGMYILGLYKKYRYIGMVQECIYWDGTRNSGIQGWNRNVCIRLYMYGNVYRRRKIEGINLCWAGTLRSQKSGQYRVVEINARQAKYQVFARQSLNGDVDRDPNECEKNKFFFEKLSRFGKDRSRIFEKFKRTNNKCLTT